ncbi:protein-glutamate O-methyltransferase CheR [Gemmata sp. JC717]|uniref:CheR family methyltransferase n=1 Tax=Gemmata algarum TaxID=2975278 RepID=UPI0021BB725A|nr:protein-glutamate O-methyltransferase CheR [Gemmata algarum]MDY3554196.1 protein-glutamate O-methyltransferase CheR [Gemmata algarum]
MTPAEFAFVCRLVRDRSAVVLEPGKEYLVEARLAALANELQFASAGELVAAVRDTQNGALSTRIVEAMVTTETLFFRDRTPFDVLRDAVLPDLISRRAAARTLNVWSAACSTGQEPYSFVLLLRQHFPELTGWKVNVLATDLSGQVLARAREGRYNQVEVSRGLPTTLLTEYFEPTGAEWQLRAGVRGAVEFRVLNLARPWPLLPPTDLVFLRNVMIYFDSETKKALLNRIARVLRPDGYLLLGSTETILTLGSPFSRVEHLKGGFHQFAK